MRNVIPKLLTPRLFYNVCYLPRNGQVILKKNASSEERTEFEKKHGAEFRKEGALKSLLHFESLLCMTLGCDDEDGVRYVLIVLKSSKIVDIVGTDYVPLQNIT